jgi:hypothetical protein
MKDGESWCFFRTATIFNFMTIGFDDLPQTTRATKLGCRKSVGYGPQQQRCFSASGAKEADNGAVRVVGGVPNVSFSPWTTSVGT